MESVIILSYETSVGSIYTEFTRGRTNIYCNELQQQCSFNERSLIGKYLLHSTSSDTSWTTRAQWVISKRLYKVFPSLFPASYSIINRNILSWKVKPLCFFSYSVFGSFVSFIICVSFCCRNSDQIEVYCVYPPWASHDFGLSCTVPAPLELCSEECWLQSFADSSVNRNSATFLRSVDDAKTCHYRKWTY